MPPQVPRNAARDGQSFAVQEAVREYTERLAAAVRTMGAPTAVQAEDYRAKPGELVLVDPTVEARTVWLPPIRRSTLGEFVRVKNASDSTNAITVRPGDASETIDGETSVAISVACGSGLFIAAAPTLWVQWESSSTRSRGRTYLTASDSTGNQSSWVDVPGTWAADPRSLGLGFTADAAAAKLTYSGATAVFLARATVSVYPNQNAAMDLGIAKNGDTVYADSELRRGGQSSSVLIGNTHAEALVQLTDGDYVKLRIQPSAASTNMTLTHGTFSLVQVD